MKILFFGFHVCSVFTKASKCRDQPRQPEYRGEHEYSCEREFCLTCDTCAERRVFCCRLIYIFFSTDVLHCLHTLISF